MNLVRFLAQYISAVGLVLFSFTVGLFNPHGRNLIRAINKHFGFTPLEPPTVLPTVTLRELASRDNCSVRLLKADQQDDGNVTLYELLCIATLVKAHEPQSIFEIGTFDGRTTLNMAANAPVNAKLYTLDLPAAEVDGTELPIDVADRKYVAKASSGSKYVNTAEAGKITQLFGDSAAFDFGAYKSGIDFIFVDGAHSYEYVKKDSETALGLTKCKKGCVILWHDYGSWPGVTQALNELQRGPGPFIGLRHITGTTLVYLCTNN